jgi:protein SCO1/2
MMWTSNVAEVSPLWRSKTLRRLSFACFLPVVLLGALASCRHAQESQHVIGHGIVVSVAEKTIRIEHEEIPGLNPAATTDFEVQDTRLLRGLQPEDEVEFTLEHHADRWRITALSPVENPEPQQEIATDDDSSPGVPIETAETEFTPHPAFDFTLTDQDGQSLTLSQLRGKVVVLDFIFTTCPGPCPLLSRTFSQLQTKLGERLGKEVMLLSVTIDPRRDTPDILKEYAKRYEANLDGWKFLTGATPNIVMATTAFGADYQANQDGIVTHRLRTCIIDRTGAIVKEFGGTSHTADDLLTEVNKLLS